METLGRSVGGVGKKVEKYLKPSPYLELDEVSVLVRVPQQQ